MIARARTFAGEPGSLARARRWVGEVLRDAGCGPAVVGAAELVVSELVKNAVVHTASGLPGGSVRVELLTGVYGARVGVIDAGTEECAPVVPRGCPDPDDPDAGRGLYLVDHAAERITVTGDARGRTVSADIPARAAHACAGLPRRQPGASLAAVASSRPGVAAAQAGPAGGASAGLGVVREQQRWREERRER